MAAETARTVSFPGAETWRAVARALTGRSAPPAAARDLPRLPRWILSGWLAVSLAPFLSLLLPPLPLHPRRPPGLTGAPRRPHSAPLPPPAPRRRVGRQQQWPLTGSAATWPGYRLAVPLFSAHVSLSAPTGTRAPAPSSFSSPPCRRRPRAPPRNPHGHSQHRRFCFSRGGRGNAAAGLLPGAQTPPHGGAERGPPPPRPRRGGGEREAAEQMWPEPPDLLPLCHCAPYRWRAGSRSAAAMLFLGGPWKRSRRPRAPRGGSGGHGHGNRGGGKAAVPVRRAGVSAVRRALRSRRGEGRTSRGASSPERLRLPRPRSGTPPGPRGGEDALQCPSLAPCGDLPGAVSCLAASRAHRERRAAGLGHGSE